MNILERLKVTVHSFKESEINAQHQAQRLTTIAKTAIESKEFGLIEKLIPNGTTYGQLADEIITKFSNILESKVIYDDLDFIEGMLGRMGAQLTMALDNNSHKTIADYIKIFEMLFHLKKTQNE